LSLGTFDLIIWLFLRPNRFVRDQFVEHHNPTVGASYFTYSLNVGGKSVRLEIWDTGDAAFLRVACTDFSPAGQERYDSIAPIYYKGADAALIVYDITSKVRSDRFLCSL